MVVIVVSVEVVLPTTGTMLLGLVHRAPAILLLRHGSLTFIPVPAYAK
jgi:hypothetical protein